MCGSQFNFFVKSVMVYRSLPLFSCQQTLGAKILVIGNNASRVTKAHILRAITRVPYYPPSSYPPNMSQPGSLGATPQLSPQQKQIISKWKKKKDISEVCQSHNALQILMTAQILESPQFRTPILRQDRLCPRYHSRRRPEPQFLCTRDNPRFPKPEYDVIKAYIRTICCGGAILGDSQRQRVYYHGSIWFKTEGK
jgi:hypothetical protein